MTIQEMHRSVMQGVDKINAQVADTILSWEIDIELNKAIQAYISTRFQQNNKHQQGFEESQKRRDDLRTMIREVEYATSFKEIVRADTHSSGALYTDTWLMPDDYMHLINVNAVVQRRLDCTKLAYQLQDQDEVFYFTTSLKNFTAFNGGPWLDEIWIVNSTELEWADEGWFGQMLWAANPDFAGLNYPTQEQLVIDSIVQAGTQSIAVGGLEPQIPFPIFWEQWDQGTPTMAGQVGMGEIATTAMGAYNFPGEHIWVINLTESTIDDMGGLFGDGESQLNADPSLGPVTTLVGRINNTSVTFSPVRQGLDTANRRVPSTPDFIRETYSCRLVQHDDIFKMVDDPFNKTKYSSPLTVMRGQRIDIYSDDIFLTDKIRLTYLKRPQAVNIAEDLGCDLPESTHEEVCKLAVLSILEEISDPRMQTHLSQVDRME